MKRYTAVIVLIVLVSCSIWAHEMGGLKHFHQYTDSSRDLMEYRIRGEAKTTNAPPVNTNLIRIASVDQISEVQKMWLCEIWARDGSVCKALHEHNWEMTLPASRDRRCSICHKHQTKDPRNKSDTWK